jgi:hypothetical protein
MGDDNYNTHSPKLLAIIEIFLINIQYPFYYQNNTNTHCFSILSCSCDIDRNQSVRVNI